MSRILPITASQRLLGLALVAAVHGAVGLMLLRGLDAPRAVAAGARAPVSARLMAPPAPPAPAAAARPPEHPAPPP